MLEELRDGDEFLGTHWPLHLTLVPNFSIELAQDRLRDLLQRALVRQESISVTAAGDDLFGPRRTVQVTLLQARQELLLLHTSIVAALFDAGAIFDNPEYVNAGYRPHVTVCPWRRLRSGDEVVVDSLAIVDMEPAEDSSRRKVLSTLKFR
ncbi:2'-5' RNA ligase family protein [Actinopolymorpha alba]|uniref:2'-5' RNA ligase family protein n=1 Tax=Actinopolymorpha alba TaxID=533267 RepID=UPI0012F6E1F6|nr:2'-5' RNA ligase family protein [Actinopolymorpha alba]